MAADMDHPSSIKVYVLFLLFMCVCVCLCVKMVCLLLLIFGLRLEIGFNSVRSNLNLMPTLGPDNLMDYTH